jgi:hypothetical protein
MKPKRSIADIVCFLFCLCLVRFFVASEFSGVGPDSAETRGNAADLDDLGGGEFDCSQDHEDP